MRRACAHLLWRCANAASPTHPSARSVVQFMGLVALPPALIAGAPLWHACAAMLLHLQLTTNGSSAALLLLS